MEGKKVSVFQDVCACALQVGRTKGRGDAEGVRETSIPRTPAEFPTKVPLRVTEFKMALIRSLELDTASCFREPSRSPQNPPRARPGGDSAGHVMGRKQ